MQIDRLHPVLAAELIGADLASPPDAARVDLVIWDNRCALHRAMSFDYLNHKRDLRRTAISDPRLVQAASELVAVTA